LLKKAKLFYVLIAKVTKTTMAAPAAPVAAAAVNSFQMTNYNT
jgi:hypothetical protein